MNKILIHIVFVLAIVVIGSLIGINNIPGEWYQSLQKPPFNPPNFIFAPVWTLLYVLIGLAGARTFLAAPHSASMKIWLVQIVLNFLWSPAFFGLQSPLLGLVVILPMLAAILAFIALRWSADRIAAGLFAPYAVWVAFASLLNLSIVLLN